MQVMLQIGTFLVKNLIAQLRLAYDNPESLEIAVKKLNDMRQKSKPFSVFISGFEKTMLEVGGLNWDEQVKKTFLNNAINTSLQEAIIATPIPATYVGYCDLLHGMNNNLEALRTKKSVKLVVIHPPIKAQGILRGILCYDLSLRQGKFAGNVCQSLRLAVWANVQHVWNVGNVPGRVRRSSRSTSYICRYLADRQLLSLTVNTFIY